MTDFTDECTMKTASFLCKATALIPSSDLYIRVRSQMTCKSLEIFQFPQNELHTGICSVCGVNFVDVVPSQRIEPVKRGNRFVRRLLKTQVHSTKYQFKSYKKFCKWRKDKQLLIITCQQCKQKYKVTVLKPQGNSKASVNVDVINTEFNKKEILKLKRLKKKEGRVFAGLNKMAVLSAAKHLQSNSDTPQPSLSTSPSNKSRNNSVVVLDDSSKNQFKTKSKVSDKIAKKREDAKKIKTVNCISKLLNTAPVQESSSSLQQFLK